MAVRRETVYPSIFPRGNNFFAGPKAVRERSSKHESLARVAEHG